MDQGPAGAVGPWSPMAGRMGGPMMPNMGGPMGPSMGMGCGGCFPGKGMAPAINPAFMGRPGFPQMQMAGQMGGMGMGPPPTPPRPGYPMMPGQQMMPGKALHLVFIRSD